VKSDIQKSKIVIREQALSKDNLAMLDKYFAARSERLLPFKSIAGDVREHMNLFSLIRNVLRPNSLVNFMNEDNTQMNNEEYSIPFDAISEN